MFQKQWRLLYVWIIVPSVEDRVFDAMSTNTIPFIGLEAQLLGIVVRKERPELEEQKDSLVINIAAGKKKLEELEDEILRLFNFFILVKLFLLLSLLG